jgi:hypothetical protein
VRYAPPEFLEQRERALISRFGAADHDGKRTFDSTALATRDWSVEIIGTSACQPLSDRTLGSRRNRTHVDNRLSFVEHRFDLGHDAFDVGRVRHHDKYHLGTPRGGGWVGSDPSLSAFGGDRLGSLGSPVVQAEAMARANQIPRHRRAHDSGSYPGDFHPGYSYCLSRNSILEKITCFVIFTET